MPEDTPGFLAIVFLGIPLPKPSAGESIWGGIRHCCHLICSSDTRIWRAEGLYVLIMLAIIRTQIYAVLKFV